MVRGRVLSQGRRHLGLSVPGGRSAWPGHRCLAVGARRDELAAARRFFLRALRAGTIPVEVTTDRAHVYPRVLDEQVPSALHVVEQYANNPVETDHGRLKARLGPMRGLKRHRSARILAAGHAFVQNLRRGHYEIGPTPPAATGSASPFTASQPQSDSRARGSFSDAVQECHNATVPNRGARRRRSHPDAGAAHYLYSIDFPAQNLQHPARSRAHGRRVNM